MNYTPMYILDHNKVPSTVEFYDILQSGPEYLNPTSINNYEPLVKIEKAEVGRIIKDW